MPASATSPDARAAAMPAVPVPAAAPAPGTVLAEILLLTAATLLLYRNELSLFIAESAYDPMRSMLVVLPLLLAAWTWRRRHDLAAALRPARVAGATLWTLGLLVHAASAWPFPVFQFRVWSLVPMLAGILLWAGGWRFLRETLPMLGVVLAALPIGARVFDQLTGRFEGVLLSVASAVLGRLPGHAAGLESIDLVVESAGGAAVVGLGAPHRALGGLLPFIALGLVVMFARRRSLPAMVLGLGAVPVLALSACLVRLLSWSVLALRGGGDPVADGPRLIGTVLALAWLWIATAVTGWILGRLLPEGPGAGARAAGPPVTATPALATEPAR